jgi:tripartite-type tricarboxylate transporter receptor subunit TctC
VIGTEAVAPSAPDGNTALLTTSAFVVTPHLRKVNYDALADFEPICLLTRTPLLIAVNSVSPYLTLADLISAARAKPGDVTLASTPGGISPIAVEMLTRAAGVKMTFVPYPSDAPAVNALLGGHVTSVFYSYPAVAAQVNAGKLRVLATVPTIAESGYKDIEVVSWYALFAPAKTPKERLAQLTGRFTAALQAPEIKSRLADLDHERVGICGSDFAAQVRKEYDRYGRVIREANIKAE